MFFSRFLIKITLLKLLSTISIGLSKFDITVLCFVPVSLSAFHLLCSKDRTWWLNLHLKIPIHEFTGSQVSDLSRHLSCHHQTTLLLRGIPLITGAKERIIVAVQQYSVCVSTAEILKIPWTVAQKKWCFVTSLHRKNHTPHLRDHSLFLNHRLPG